MGEETLNGDLPPAYSSIVKPGDCSDTITINTSEVVESDKDEDPLVTPSFENKSTRIVFIQKVLAIRCLQVAAVSGFIIAVYKFCDVNFWLNYAHIKLYYWIMPWSLVHGATVIPLLYWKDVDKKTPYNYIFFVTNTISTVFVMIVITTGILKGRDEFFIARIFYAILTLALLLYTVLIRDSSLVFRARDASLLTGGLSILIIAITASIIYTQCPYYDMFAIIYLTLLFSVVCAHAVYRLQLITSGKYHRALTPADVFSAALYSQIDLVCDSANLPVNLLIKSVSDTE